MKINEMMWMDESKLSFFPAVFSESCERSLILYVQYIEKWLQ